LSFLVVLAVLFVVAIVPIMIGARIVGARNTGIGAALLTVMLVTGISAAGDRFIGNAFLGFLVSASAGGFLIAAILGTTFWRALAVSIIATAIQIGVALLLFGAVMVTA
jgi:hypothetical protein